MLPGALLANATEGPRQGSFLPSLPGSLCGTSCLAGSVSTAALRILSSAVQVVGCAFLAREYRKRGDAKALVLARRRGTADKQAWSSVLTAAFDSFHLASAIQAQRRNTSKGPFFKMWRTGEGSAKMMQMPRPEVSEQLFLHAIMFELFLSSKAGRRSRKPGEGQVSLSHIGKAPVAQPWP